MRKQCNPEQIDQTSTYYFYYGFFSTAVFWILSLVSAALAFFQLVELIRDILGYVSTTEVDVIELLTTAGYFLFLAFYSLMISSPYPNVRVSNAGLTVQVFLFWWAFVPWDDVCDLQSTLLGHSRLVVLRRLTPIHRVYGLIFGLTFQPGFVIRRRIKDYDLAVKMIEKRVSHQ